MLEVMVIADDLTGAADTGVCFLGGGPVKVVNLDHSSHSSDWGLAVDTGSRNATDEILPELMLKASALVKKGRPRIIYKKIDSCLRGQIGLELEILLANIGMTGALVAPAYPRLGRLTRNGLHYVGGSLVSESETARDPLRPVTDARLAAIIGRGCGLPVRPIGLDLIRDGAAAVLAEIRSGEGIIWAADAETDADLDILATAGLAESRRLILSGSAGLAVAVSRCMGISPQKPEKINAPRPTVFLAGSASTVLKEQIDYLAEKEGAQVLTLNPAELMAPASAAFGDLPGGPDNPPRPLVINLPPPNKVSPYSSQQIIAAFGQAAARIVAARQPQSIFMSGGDTARATLNALGINGAWLKAEIEPGVVLLEAGSLTIVTKSGGFGDRELLRRLYRGPGEQR